MDTCVRLTVYFDEPFWVGVFERTEGGRLSVCKVTFGAEPRDFEVLEFVESNYCKLKFSPTVEATVRKLPTNPKRIQREVRRQMQSTGIGTKSQQALQLQREQNKLERKTASRQEREAEDKRKFEQRQQKRKEKHRGS